MMENENYQHYTAASDLYMYNCDEVLTKFFNMVLGITATLPATLPTLRCVSQQVFQIRDAY